MKKLLLVLSLMTIFISGCSTYESTEIPTPTIQSAVVETAAPTENPLPENSTFAVHYIDVGQADAALVLCDGQTL